MNHPTAAQVATTVLIRKDRHGNAYMADSADDLLDGAVLIHKSPCAEAKLIRAMSQALDSIRVGKPLTAAMYLQTALDNHKAGR